MKETEKLPTPTPAFIYLIVALVIGMPLLGSGFILSLDLVYTPNIPFPTDISASYPFRLLIALLSHVLSPQIVEKALLIGTLFLAGWGAHQLIEKIIVPSKNRSALHFLYPTAAYFAGILYMINPFVYSRFMAGQISVLLGYALLPLCAVWIINFLTKPTLQTGGIAAGGLLLLSIVSIHTLLPALIVGIALGVLYYVRNRHDTVWLKQTIRFTLFGTLAFMIASSYWLIALLLHHNHSVHALQSFDHTDSIAFATNGQGLGVIGNLLSLQGFWGDAKNLYLMPADVVSWWLIPIILFWIMALAGAVFAYKKQRSVGITFTTILGIGLILASGPTGTIFGGLNSFLFTHVPFFDGYREPQKFAVLIALSLIYFGAWGIIAGGRLLARIKKPETAKAISILLLLPAGLAPLMFFGFHNQLHPKQYPVDWQAIHERLQAENHDSKILFLPWHMYMRFDFAGRIVANPAPAFFGPAVISSNDPELQGAKSNISTTSEQAVVQNRLLDAIRHGDQSASTELKKIHVGYILLAKEQDYKKYSQLDSLPGVTLLQETESLKLYKVLPDKGDKSAPNGEQR